MNGIRKITVKWNKDVHNLEVNSTTVAELKNQIFSLTNVEANRQKLLLKGKSLDDAYLIVNIPEGSTLTLMGTANASSMINVDSEKKVFFLEDLTKEDKAAMLRAQGDEIVFGLENLGNTCYLNSTLQALGRVPELRKQLQDVQGNRNNDITFAFTKSLGGVYKNLDTASDTIKPELLVNNLRTMNPQFADAEKGVFKQQDAEECWSLILNSVRDHLPNKTQGEKFSSNAVDELFGIEFEIELKNIEIQTEVKHKKEIVHKLQCYIDTTTTELVNGLKKNLKENIDLFSDTLGRGTVFEKTQLISRLPPYLTIQFMRFFWKQANVSTGTKANKAKILKSVMFSKVIDLYDLCSEGTKEILNLGRNIETKMLKNDKNYRVGDSVAQEGKEMIPTGRFQLISLVTHEGRSSESGHYIGWANKKDDKWTKFDDDNITQVNLTDILELKGGGDWPMAYMAIYKRMEVPFQEVDDMQVDN